MLWKLSVLSVWGELCHRPYFQNRIRAIYLKNISPFAVKIVHVWLVEKSKRNKIVKIKYSILYLWRSKRLNCHSVLFDFFKTVIFFSEVKHLLDTYFNWINISSKFHKPPRKWTCNLKSVFPIKKMAQFNGSAMGVQVHQINSNY